MRVIRNYKSTDLVERVQKYCVMQIDNRQADKKRSHLEPEGVLALRFTPAGNMVNLALSKHAQAELS